MSPLGGLGDIKPFAVEPAASLETSRTPAAKQKRRRLSDTTRLLRLALVTDLIMNSI
jgi:hypothetical protein